MCNFLFWRFVSGSYSKTQQKKKHGSFSICSKKTRNLSLLLSFLSYDRFFRTIFTQIFFISKLLVTIWWTVMWVNFKCYPIILTVNRWSTRIRSWILTMFSSFFAVGGLPQQGSYSIDFLHSEYALNHLKNWALERYLLC